MATAEIIRPLDRHKEGHIEAMWKGAMITIGAKQEPSVNISLLLFTVTAAVLCLSLIYIVLLSTF